MTIITTVIGFFLNSRLGQYALGAAGVFALVTWFAVSNQNKGVEKERVRVQQAGAQVEKKAIAARATAERDARRLLKQWERD